MRGAYLEQAVIEVQPNQAAVRVDHAGLAVVDWAPHVVLYVAVGARHKLACSHAGSWTCMLCHTGHMAGTARQHGYTA